MIAGTSCSTETECECTTSYDQQGMQDQTTTETVEDGECSDLDETYTENGMTVTMTCEEK